MKSQGKKIIAVSACVTLVFVIVAIIGAAGRLSSQVDLRRLEARRLGGEYLGRSGVVMQDKRTNCGAAALKMIFEERGIHRSLREIEASLWRTGKGTSMLALRNLAEASGIFAEGWRYTFQDFAQCPFPAILFVHGNHFVVADSVHAGDVVCIRDPALGKVTLRRENLLRIWNGETLVFRGGRNAQRPDIQ